ncbi:unnamed protein product [Lymnaea stagnalis]|uniref:Fibrinogen C-terminal domain-containing protein n=1 Tax=Lymnaea stagnalis TaxID=6523 RepID=A0AAV2ID03_LYMST
MGWSSSAVCVFGIIFLQYAAGNPHLSVHPQPIRVGLARNFTAFCTVSDLKVAGWSSVASLVIRRNRNRVSEPIADVHSSASAVLRPSAGDAVVSGALSNAENYISVTWKNPDGRLEGEYICEGTGVDIAGAPASFSDTVLVAVEYPSKDEYITALFQLYNEQDKMAETINAAYAVGNSTEQKLQNALATVSRLRVDGCVEELNGTGCDDPKLPVGYNVVNITPKDGLGAIRVLCQVRAVGEGWVVFQKRFDGSVDFYRDFHDYENGFGTVGASSEFWLGLKNLRRLLVDNGDANQIRVDMTELGTGYNFTRIYPTFTIGPDPEYTLIADGYDDGARGLSENAGAQFQTFDRDSSGGCPSSLRLAGWWFNQGCGYVNLNGLWGLPGGEASMFWYEIYNHPLHSMQATELKFRPRTPAVVIPPKQ